MATTRSKELQTLAQRVADALPADVAEEVVLTGSVSRGLADELSDIEMLVVTREPLDIEDCFGLARAAGLEGLDTWGARDGQTRRVSGYRERVPLELVWWSREYAEARMDALLAGEARVAPLAIKPDRLPTERIEEAVTEPDPRRALRVMTALQLETVLLAPSGPNVDRARGWLAEAAELLR
jgi:predicted nucleotidyltransferase